MSVTQVEFPGRTHARTHTKGPGARAGERSLGRAQNDQFLYEPGRGGRVFAEEDAPPASASPARASYTGAPARKGRETFALTAGPGFQKASPVLCAICDHNGQSCTFNNHWSPPRRAAARAKRPVFTTESLFSESQAGMHAQRVV